MSLAAEVLSPSSIISKKLSPVNGSEFLTTVTPSTKSIKTTRPEFSAIIGWVCGSQSAILSFAFTLPPSWKWTTAPYGNLYRSFTCPNSLRIEATEDLEITTKSPLVLVIDFMFSKWTIPLVLILILLTAVDALAAPPIWNVRIVNCVPGSPIDCAAITPTASPTPILWPRAISLP